MAKYGLFAIAMSIAAVVPTLLFGWVAQPVLCFYGEKQRLGTGVFDTTRRLHYLTINVAGTYVGIRLLVRMSFS